MPYIKEERRTLFANLVWRIINNISQPGDLCYCVYKMMKGLSDNDPNFKNMSSLIAEIESAKLEFYRKVVAPYEDKKIEENGDV